MNINELDPIVFNLIKQIPKDIQQAQYATNDQIRVLLEVARKLKLYDALEVIKLKFNL
jgi:hypothetical protein